MILQTLFLIYFCIGLSHHSPTERSVDSYSDDSYEEIFPIPLLDYLKEHHFTNKPGQLANLPTSLSYDNQLPNQIDLMSNDLSNGQVNLHALPGSIELNAESFIIVHKPNRNQYLDLGKVNSENVEKKYVLIELRPQSIRPNASPINEFAKRSKDLTSITIQSNSFNLDLSLSISQSTTTPPSSLNASSTSLNVMLSSGKNESVSLNLVSNETHHSTINATSANNLTKLTGLATSELISTNIEQPKELARNVAKKHDPIGPIRPTMSDEIEMSRTSADEVDNSTTLNNATYSLLGEDNLNLNVNDLSFNKINSSSLDLILDLNDTTLADEISLNSTTRIG